jgi:pimeloyl-ACP methyl ester carboxylesterase
LSQVPTATIGSAGVVRLRAGRMVTFVAAGPDDGFPIVYCHGAIGSPRWHTPGLDSALEGLSVRYLVVNRPGFGGSDPAPGRTVADHAGDVGELMTVLGYHRFSVVGVSAGAPYALACGWTFADRLVALAAVSPLGPPDGPGASPSLRYKIPLVPYGSARVGFALGHLSLRALGLQRQTCAQAMIDDYLVCRRDWGFHPADLRIPVTLWHGRGDRLVPLAHTLALAAAIPGSEARVDRRGGHFFYSRRLAEILGSLLPDGAAGTSRVVAEPLLRAA